MRIGFIGLGNMGGAIARRLVRYGLDVVVCDISPAALRAFDEPDARRVADPLEAARRSDVLGVCVRTDAQLETLAADGALFREFGRGGLFILNSTVAPDLARRLARLANAEGVDFIDVGVSGGVEATAEGKLSLFVGGDEAAVARARPFLDPLGTVAHLGPVGRGLEGKLLNNLATIANFGVAAAILDLGVELDFDREQLRQALLVGSARGFAFEMMPTLLAWRGPLEPSNWERIRDLLRKDVSHAAELIGRDHPAMAALIASSHSMLDRFDRTPVKTRDERMQA